MTRKEYMDVECITNGVYDREKAHKLHREYYAQYVDAGVINRVRARFTNKELQLTFADNLQAQGRPPLTAWDMLLLPCPAHIAAKLSELGDFPTTAGLVCIAKEAGRQILENDKTYKHE